MIKISIANNLSRNNYFNDFSRLSKVKSDEIGCMQGKVGKNFNGTVILFYKKIKKKRVIANHP